MPNHQSLISNLYVWRFTPHISLFLFLFAVYLLTYTPRINSSDGQAMFATAESLVRRGALDIEQLRWLDLQQGTYGLDGLLYSRKGIGVPIGLLPLTWLGLLLPWWGTVGASLLFNAIITALAAVLLLVYLQELGFSQRVGLIVALTFGLTTLAWPYAKSLFSDPFSGLLLLGAAYALLKFSRGAGERGSGGEKNLTPAPERSLPVGLPLRSPALLIYPFVAGLLLGWNVAARYAEAIFLPVFGLLLLYYLYNLQRSTFNPLREPSTFNVSRFTFHALPPILAFSIPLFLIGLALIAFNISRYGDPFNTGYLPNETFSGSLWQGLLGQLVSPGRGLFLYCPIFLLSLIGILPFFRHHRPEAITALSIILIHLFLYGKWFMWHGGYAWGPRFMVPTLPFWAIFLAPIVTQAFLERRRGEDTGGDAKRAKKRTSSPHLLTSPSPRLLASSPHRLTASTFLRLTFLLLAALGLIPQLLSAAIDFAPFQNSLLDAGLPLFDPQTFFDPQYSPFVGAWRLITLDSLDLAWAWHGQVNGWLLAVLTVNIVLTSFNMGVNMFAGQPTGRGSNGSGRFYFSFMRAIPAICILSMLIAVPLLLAHAHTLPSKLLTEAVTALNEAVQPTDAVITNDPNAAQSFAELYKGRAPVLGLNSGGPPLPGDVIQRINEIMAHHRQVWWLPGGLLPEQSAVEQMLMTEGFRVRNDDFGGERLVLFAYPSDLANQTVKVGKIYGDQIILVDLAYPAQASAGTALPVELHWQALAKLRENYHVFIHLVADEGQSVAQADGQPALWTRPTTTWAVGETIVDRHGLRIPPQTVPGDYELRIGLYQPIEGKRLMLEDGNEWVRAKVVIQRP